MELNNPEENEHRYSKDKFHVGIFIFFFKYDTKFFLTLGNLTPASPICKVFP
jgi:hypothetical protein